MQKRGTPAYLPTDNELRLIQAVYERLGKIAGSYVECVVHRTVSGFGNLPARDVQAIRTMADKEFDVDLPC